MRYLLLFLLCFADLMGADPLPADAQKVVDAQTKATAAAKAVYDDAVSKATVDAVSKLEKVVKETTKKGDLAGALAAQKVLDELKATLVPDLLGTSSTPVDLAKEIIGKWQISAAKHSGTPIVFEAGGVANWGGRMTGTWNGDANTVKVTWSNQVIYTITKKDGVLTYIEARGDEPSSTGKLTK